MYILFFTSLLYIYECCPYMCFTWNNLFAVTVLTVNELLRKNQCTDAVLWFHSVLQRRRRWDTVHRPDDRVHQQQAERPTAQWNPVPPSSTCSDSISDGKTPAWPATVEARYAPANTQLPIYLFFYVHLPWCIFHTLQTFLTELLVNGQNVNVHTKLINILPVFTFFFFILFWNLFIFFLPTIHSSAILSCICPPIPKSSTHSFIHPAIVFQPGIIPAVLQG